jgi:hypothetical protein
MPGHNSYPGSHEQSPTQTQVQFEDGEIALGYRTKDDKLVLGYSSDQKYARDFHGGDMAWIKTTSGNRYGIGRGLIINQNTNNQQEGPKVYRLPDDDLEVTIGKPLSVPGAFETSNVSSVLLRYKVAAPGQLPPDQQVAAPSPFVGLDVQCQQVYAANPQLR